MKKIPVLMYHNMTDTNNIAEKSKFITVSLSNFQKDMEYIKNNYTTIFVNDLWNYVNSGIELPDNCIMVTFDDGYLSFYQYAYPIIKQQKIKATMSLIVSRINQPRPEEIPKLTWDQVKEMYESGHIDFQSHSYDMHYCPTTPEDTKRLGCLQKHNESLEEYQNNIKNDYLRAKYDIENKIHNNVISHFYPYGKYSEESYKILSAAGCNLTFIATNLQNKDPHIISYGDKSTLHNIDRLMVYNGINLTKINYLSKN